MTNTLHGWKACCSDHYKMISVRWNKQTPLCLLLIIFHNINITGQKEKEEKKKKNVMESESSQVSVHSANCCDACCSSACGLLDMTAVERVRWLTPQFIVVGAAVCLSAAVARFAQVAWTVVHTRAVLGTGNRNATGSAVALRHLVDKARYYNEAQNPAISRTTGHFHILQPVEIIWM